MLKSEPQITLQDWTWHDFKRTYITIANFHSKEIGYYSYKFNKLVLTTDLKIPDDLLLFIRDELYKNLGKKARLVITH